MFKFFEVKVPGQEESILKKKYNEITQDEIKGGQISELYEKCLHSENPGSQFNEVNHLIEKDKFWVGGANRVVDKVNETLSLFHNSLNPGNISNVDGLSLDNGDDALKGRVSLATAGDTGDFKKGMNDILEEVIRHDNMSPEIKNTLSFF